MAIPVPEKRIAEFENFGFGMFVHWGLYSKLGKGEKIKAFANIPMNEYAKLKDTFTAENFDGRKLAKLAKAAGARYITLTTRHHDGFSLYDTCGLNDFDAPHSPAGRDLIRDFVDGCNAEGIVPFFYHTTLDWYNPDFNNNFPKYLQYLRDSVEILCTNYGKIGGLWFDGNWAKPNADWEEDALYAVIRKHQPDAIIVNNTGVTNRGELGNIELDSVTFENGRPSPMDREGHKKYIAAEMCQTMGRYWGYGVHDKNCKSLAHLIETLCNCRKVGANYLLNIGPDAEGNPTPLQDALLREIGEWIHATGDVIYTAKPCGITGDGKNFALRDGNKLYFFVHDLQMRVDEDDSVNDSTNPQNFFGVNEKIKSVRWIDEDGDLNFTQNGSDTVIYCTGYPYGKDLVVRIAEAEIE